MVAADERGISPRVMIQPIGRAIEPKPCRTLLPARLAKYQRTAQVR